MPRRSSPPVQSRPVAPAASKRRASARLSASHTVKRAKSDADLAGGTHVKSTARKSKYFEGDSSDESEGEEESEGSVYEEEPLDDQEESDPEPELEPEVSDSEKENESKKTPRSKNKKDDHDRDALKGKELWREGVTTGLGPGKEVFIAKPKARDAGGVPYRDETLHPNTRLFLLDLAANNERPWLKAHDADFRAAKKDWETFVESLTPKISEKDATIPELPVKDLVFRIYRDIRFSKNPLPYKSRSRTGKKGPYAAYYVHFQPGSCFVGGGLWHPEADSLAALREDIDENADRWKELLRAPGMRREFLNGVADDDDAVVKAFAYHNRDSALKTKPKGYEADNKNIQLLRLRSFTLGRPVTDAVLTSADDAQERIADLVGIMEPWVTYLNSVVRPDH
ncbi:Conserved hypothetical protein CHP02453 [Penicillium lagena]|uniref:Conserved hypothetical protein CHP02453 n=1 Tax=Penicillium lagena TaxID=94218 RepID=UPI00254018D9|nr:Conserved hypothetical protein CHP02453 [Penicillium lagena]KAJ5612156.1 Conserved hypothetical protein CHP02453 [Penicillium lagena]